MGTFRTTIAIENPLRRGTKRELPHTLVDTGAELTWAPTAVLEELGIESDRYRRRPSRPAQPARLPRA